MRAAASDSCRSLRVMPKACVPHDAHGSLPLTSGTACHRAKPHEDKILRQDADSWRQGYKAGLSGEPLSARPYPVGTIASWSWHSGYIEGKAARLASVKNTTIKLDESRQY